MASLFGMFMRYISLTTSFSFFDELIKWRSLAKCEHKLLRGCQFGADTSEDSMMDRQDAVIAFSRVIGSLLRKHFSRSLLST